jgi:hypothetical protein
MSDRPDERGDQAKRRVERLNRRIAEVAQTLADTEERVANTFEEVAKHRPPAEAQWLRLKADQARRYAVKERGRSAEYALHSDDRRADEPEGGGTRPAAS